MADPRGKFEALALAWLMVMSVFAMTATFAGVSAAANTLVVDDDGGEDYTSIQAAINNASSGDTIEVREGNYSESLNIDVSNLTLVATGDRSNTVVSGSGSTNVVKIQPTATGVTIDGFTLQDGERRGIFVGDFGNAPENTEIVNNRIHSIGTGTVTNEVHGILIETGADNSLVENNLIENIEDGDSDRSVGISVVSQESTGVDSVGIRNNVVRNVVTTTDSNKDEKAKGIELSGKVTNILIEDNEVYDIGDSSSTSKPRGLALLETDIGGTLVGPSDFVIRGNDVHSIHTDGSFPAVVVFFGGYKTTFGSNHEVTNNNFVGDAFEVFTDNAEELNVERNYWGSPDGPSGEGTGSGTTISLFNSATVSFIPWYATGTTTPSTENVEVVRNPVIVLSDRIQPAVDASQDGDTVEVHPGTYDGIVVDKNVTLVGVDGPSDTKIEGGSDNGILLPGHTDKLDGVEIRGFTLRSSDKFALAAFSDSETDFDTKNLTVRNIVVDGSNSSFGIGLFDVKTVRIAGSELVGLSWNDAPSGGMIEIVGAEDVEIFGNEISGNAVGVNLKRGTEGVYPPNDGIIVAYNNLLNNDIDIRNNDEDTGIFAPLNWYGDRRAEPANRTIEGNVVYDPFLTAPQEDVEKGPDKTQKFAHDLVLEAGEGPQAVAVPGPTKRTVGELLQELGTGVAVWEWNTSTERLEHPDENDSVESLDAFIVVSQSDDARVVFDYEDDGGVKQFQTQPLNEGWNFVGAPQTEPVSESITASSTPDVRKVGHIYNQPESQPRMIGEGDPSPFLVTSDSSKQTSAYTGYWVLVSDSGEISAALPSPGTTVREEIDLL